MSSYEDPSKDPSSVAWLGTSTSSSQSQRTLLLRLEWLSIISSLFRNYFSPPIVFATLKDRIGSCKTRPCIGRKPSLVGIQEDFDGHVHNIVTLFFWFHPHGASSPDMPQIACMILKTLMFGKICTDVTQIGVQQRKDHGGKQPRLQHTHRAPRFLLMRSQFIVFADVSSVLFASSCGYLVDARESPHTDQFHK